MTDWLRRQLLQLRLMRWFTRGVLVLGIVVSGAANVLHAEPNAISRTISAWPPLALFLAVELISRVPVEMRHRRSRALGRLVAAGAIAGIAAWVSYWHMAGVAFAYGEDEASSMLLPLTVDGLVVVASITLVELNARIREHERSAEPVPVEEQVTISRDDHEEVVRTVPVEPEIEVMPEPVKGWPVPPLPAQLINAAHEAAQQHLAETGQPISRDQLQKHLRVSNATTGDVMRAIGLNGQSKTLAAAAVSPLTGKPLM